MNTARGFEQPPWCDNRATQCMASRPAIPNMGNLSNYDPLRVLITDSDAQCAPIPIHP